MCGWGTMREELTFHMVSVVLNLIQYPFRHPEKHDARLCYADWDRSFLLVV